MKILIASPSYDGNVRKEYMRSVMVLTDYFRQAGIAWDICLESSTLLHVIRSVMASKAMLDEQTTHVFFVDTDMGFSVGMVRKLIAAERDVIGCAYPYRSIPLHEEVRTAGQTLRRTIAESVPYAVHLQEGKENMTVTGGICEVAGIGTGLMLIRTDALRTMKARAGLQVYRNHFPYSQWFGHPDYFGFFDYVTRNGVTLGEDLSFCDRWTKDCGGLIHAVVDEEVQHVGPVPVVGRYLDRLASGRA